MITVDRAAFPDSRAIEAIRYFPDRRNLEVTFKSRSVYLYHDVPERVAEEFSQAESAGGYFHDAILDRYRFTRLK